MTDIESIQQLPPGLTEMIGEIRRVTEAVKNGSLNERAETLGMGEYSDAIAAVNEMLDSILRPQRHTSLLDQISAGIQLADENHNIVYINPALIEVFTEAEDEIRKSIPHFDSGKLVGMNLAHHLSVPTPREKPAREGYFAGTSSVDVGPV